MKKKDKELLLKDLSARLPYGVKVYDTKGDITTNSYTLAHINGIIGKAFITSVTSCRTAPIEDLKPYLFPMTNITNRQAKKYYSLADELIIKGDPGRRLGMKIHCIKLGISDNPHEEVWDWVDMEAIDWLNANHFDYRGLIKKGLAIDATGKNIY